MDRDGWWWCDPAATNKSIRRGILKEMLAQRVAEWRGRVTD
jgi:glutamate-1-semialdehyde 2,1-aminomutase